MPKTHVLNESDIPIIETCRKQNKDKQVEKRLYAVKLRAEGKTNKEIAEILETSSDVISYWVSLYKKQGIKGLLPKPKTGRPTQISFEEEAKMLAEFDAQAEAGQMVEVSDIKAAYQKKVGHTIGTAQIYYVLKRHGWRKIKPRSRHPKKASPEVIEASKKLTLAPKK